jgi:hypothetical protein
MVVRAARVLEALGPLAESLDPPADAVPLWPAMAQQAVSAALLQSLGPGGWAHRPPPSTYSGDCWFKGDGDEGEGGMPTWPVWFHLHMLGVLGDEGGRDEGGGGSAGSAGATAPTSASAAQAAAVRCSEPRGEEDARAGRMAELLRAVYSDPDARWVCGSLRAQESL